MLGERERERSQKSQFDGVIRRYLAAEEKMVLGETEFPSLIIACETLSKCCNRKAVVNFQSLTNCL